MLVLGPELMGGGLGAGDVHRLRAKSPGRKLLSLVLTSRLSGVVRSLFISLAARKALQYGSRVV